MASQVRCALPAVAGWLNFRIVLINERPVDMALPISKTQAHSVARWMKTNFGGAIRAAVGGTSFSLDNICGIGCQETAYFWVTRMESLTVDEILARCVLDASGDIPGHLRNFFPKNTAKFRERYGNEFTEMLIAEANQTRAIRGFAGFDGL